MRLPAGFSEQLALKPDAELFDMLAHQQDYLPEAVLAAKVELGRRNLAPTRITQLEAGIQSKMAEAEAKAQERLGWPLRILIFCLFAGMAGAVLAVYFEHKGYKGKASDCWVTVGVSAGFHLLAGTLVFCARQ